MENDNLISKKELLEKYGISYGALYRWKRKGLIPDDWFIKKSTVTGQETFFPRELVCERVELILNEKEEVLLDELAKKISGQQSADRVLTLMTAFGEKSFRMSDVKSIILESGKGKKTDITQIIQNLFDTEDKSI